MNLCDTGIFVYPTATTTSDPATSPHGSWTNLGNYRDIEILAYRGYNQKATLNGKKNLNYSGYTFFMPQPLPDFDLSDPDHPKGVYLKMALAFEKDGVPVWPYPTSHGYDPKEKTAVIYFPLSTDKLKSWQPGKSYVYSIYVGIPKDASPISFDVNVKEYDGIGSDDVDNQQ